MRTFCTSLFFLCFVHITIGQASFTLAASLCETDTTLVSAGTGTFPANSFFWSSFPAGPVFSAPNSSVSLISFPSAGTYTILLGMTSGSLSSGVYHSIVIHPPPSLTLSSSPSSLCVGESATLTASGALSYVWTPTLGLYFFSNSLAYTSPNVSSSYSIVGTNSLGCKGTTAYTLDVQNYPNLLLSSTSTVVCAGFTSTLTATGAGSYTWTGGSFSVPVTQHSVATGAGSYSVVGANGVCRDSAQIVIALALSLQMSVTASRFQICTNLEDSLLPVYLDVSGASQYSWTPYEQGRMTYSLGPSTAVSPSVTTCYTVTGSTSACQGSTAICIQVSTCTAIEETHGHSFATVFPNPVLDELFIRTKHSGLFEFRLINITGSLMLEDKVPIRENDPLKIRLDDLPPGIYFLYILEQGNRTQTMRILRQ